MHIEHSLVRATGIDSLRLFHLDGYLQGLNLDILMLWETDRPTTMLHAHTPLSMSLCHVNFPGKMQTSIPSQMYMPNTFEGHGVTEFDATHFGPILELRKEKSRDAARSRRGKENYEFYELAKMLPLPAAITSQLDKASIIRLTISCLKLRDFSSTGDPPWQRDGPPPNKAVKGGPPRRRSMTAVAMEIFETHQGTHILQSLDGFTFALSNDGRFLYISETVSIYLGLSQVEMTGSTIFDYVHVQDHQEMAEQLGLAAPQSGAYPSPGSGASDEGASSTSTTPRAVTPTIPERASFMNPNPSRGYDRCFCIRMKSTLTKRGVHIKSSGYRVVQILAHMRPQIAFTLSRKHPPPLLGLVAVAIALPPPTITELLIDNDMFVTRLSPDLKVTYCEPRISDMMDISADDLTNKNLYDYCHAEDLQKLRKAHIDLLNKGQVLTDYYRLMNKHGGYVWIQTCATIICNAKNAEEQNIIAINYVLSGVEYSGCVMDMNQYKMMTKMEPDQSDQSENENGSEKDDKDSHERKTPDSGNGEGCRKGHKRKRKISSSHDDTSSENHDIMAVEPRSPADGFDSLLGHSSGGTFNGDVFCDDKSSDKNKTDINKNSRRKCDKPRKMPRRKSESEDETHGEAHDQNGLDIINNDSRDGSHIHENGVIGSNRPGSVHSLAAPTSPLDLVNKIRSPVPQDLSLSRVSQSPMTTTQSPQNHRTITPAISISNTLENSRENWVAATSTVSEHSADASASGSSVMDLEKAMNKHLPTLPSENDHIRAGLVSDYSPAMLGFQHKNHSTIKWIGSQHSAHATEQLPATNFLKSLYANRESVIRSNICNPRPQYYTADMQNSLLTPPGMSSDPYKDSSYTSSQISQSKTPPSTIPYSLMGYSSSPISVSMTHNMAEPYAMTPPSSVSPQEKYSASYADQLHADSTQLRQYDGSLTIPIKPQAYPMPAHSNSHMPGYDRTQAQYPAAGYYTTTSSYPSYNHPTSPTPAHYRDNKTGNSW